MLNTIHAVAEDIRLGRLSPVELLESCLNRIDNLEPWLQAWVLIDRDRARAEAAQRAEEQRHGRYRGPLHGIPLGIKDIIDVGDWPTAAGFRPWANSIAREDATVVERLRQAGAVLIGKTVTTQFASYDPPPTRNPWNRERTPGGSSSGSAAAVAAGMCLGALGTQTGGSLTRPASYCGVASCKPTFGRVSRHGIVPLATSLDHPGPIGRYVHDLAVLLQAMAGPDPQDPSCSGRPMPDLTAALGRDLTPPSLGRVHGLFDERAEPAVKQMMNDVIDILCWQRAKVIDIALPAGFGEVLHRHNLVMAVEAALFHRDRLKRHPDDYQPCIRTLLEEGLACPAPEYAHCKVHQRRLTADMVVCFEGVNALLTPATTSPAPDTPHYRRPGIQRPLELYGPADGVAAGRPQCRGPAVGHPARRSTLGRGSTVPGGGVVRENPRRADAGGANVVGA